MIGTAPEIGGRIRALRKQKGFTMEDLEARCGVSQSTLSKIERDETNPTYATLWSITRALGVDMSALTDAISEVAHDSIDVLQPHKTPEVTSKNGDCVLRILAPGHLWGRVEWYEITLAAGASLQSAAHDAGAEEHLTAIDGAFEVVSGDATAHIEAGGTARYAADKPHAIKNAAKKTSKGLLVVMKE
ncbi:MAG: XRE family transcriptional regulator [Pseudomonadota bacterium]